MNERKRASDSRLYIVLDFGASFLISGFLAIMFKSMIAPLERVRLILQTQASSHQIGSAERTEYTGVLNALIRIPKEQGFLSLWRGNLLNAGRYFPTQAIHFSLYDLYYNAFEQILETRTQYSHILLPFFTGGVVGLTSTTILFPLNLCATRMTVDVGDNNMVQREFHGLNDCMRKVYRNDGIRGFYRGLVFEGSAVFVFRSIYFGIYVAGKERYLHSYKINAPVWVSLAIAQLASVVGTIVAYPLDTISRQQMICNECINKKHKRLQLVINNIVKKDGLVGFYRGVSANLLSSICGTSVLVTYDIIKNYFNNLVESKKSKPQI